jgi:hypothetical protein
MADQLTCLSAEQAQNGACARSNGWPAAPGIYSGEGTPEASWTGFWLGDLYMNTTNGTLYAFNGTPGENTGWVAQV